MASQLVSEILGFDWNSGNKEKNKARHNVEWWECDEIFFNDSFFTTVDRRHSDREEGHFGFGSHESQSVSYGGLYNSG
jgi:uncharacterized DUF497 family protein